MQCCPELKQLLITFNHYVIVHCQLLFLYRRLLVTKKPVTNLAIRPH